MCSPVGQADLHRSSLRLVAVHDEHRSLLAFAHERRRRNQHGADVLLGLDVDLHRRAGGEVRAADEGKADGNCRGSRFDRSRPRQDLQGRPPGRRQRRHEMGGSADDDARRVGERHRRDDFEPLWIDDAQHRIARRRLRRDRPGCGTASRRRRRRSRARPSARRWCWRRCVRLRPVPAPPAHRPLRDPRPPFPCAPPRRGRTDRAPAPGWPSRSRAAPARAAPPRPGVCTSAARARDLEADEDVPLPHAIAFGARNLRDARGFRCDDDELGAGRRGRRRPWHARRREWIQCAPARSSPGPRVSLSTSSAACLLQAGITTRPISIALRARVRWCV